MYLDNINAKKVIFIEFFYYENTKIKKQLFIGVCIKITKKGLDSSIVLRNVLGGIIIEQQFLIFNTKIIRIQNSKKYYLNYKKSKLYFLKNFPQFYRINQVVLKETFFYKKKLKKVKKKKISI